MQKVWQQADDQKLQIDNALQRRAEAMETSWIQS